MAPLAYLCWNREAAMGLHRCWAQLASLVEAADVAATAATAAAAVTAADAAAVQSCASGELMVEDDES